MVTAEQKLEELKQRNSDCPTYFAGFQYYATNIQ
jgi:hypothetical protein